MMNEGKGGAKYQKLQAIVDLYQKYGVCNVNPKGFSFSIFLFELLFQVNAGCTIDKGGNGVPCKIGAWLLSK